MKTKWVFDQRESVWSFEQDTPKNDRSIFPNGKPRMLAKIVPVFLENGGFKCFCPVFTDALSFDLDRFDDKKFKVEHHELSRVQTIVEDMFLFRDNIPQNEKAMV